MSFLLENVQGRADDAPPSKHDSPRTDRATTHSSRLSAWMMRQPVGREGRRLCESAMTSKGGGERRRRRHPTRTDRRALGLQLGELLRAHAGVSEALIERREGDAPSASAWRRCARPWWARARTTMKWAGVDERRAATLIWTGGGECEGYRTVRPGAVWSLGREELTGASRAGCTATRRTRAASSLFSGSAVKAGVPF